MQITQEQIERLLTRVRRPSRYIGSEINSADKPWDSAKLHWCLVFPDTYEIGMSHIGLEVIYHILNSQEGVLADRCFTPWTDMETAMREDKVPLWGLESHMPLREFDVIGITLPYELTYTNILTMLDLAGIPFYAKERGGKYPLIIGGGVGAFNPEPVAEFFDAIVLGDGEEVVGKISVEVLECRSVEVGKQEMLEKLAKIRGVYVPDCHCEPRVAGRGNPPNRECIQEIASLPSVARNDTPFGVKKAIVPDINSAPYPTKPIVPFMQVVHDRVGVEIQRGCVRGCRFCQAGFIYRPVRQRRPETVEELANKALIYTGNEELSFLSLSAGDYERLPDVIRNVNACHSRESGNPDNSLDPHFRGDGTRQWVNISLPSLRVETLTKDVLEVLGGASSVHPPFAKGGRGGFKGGFTLAPEAATERLRNVINKGNTEGELLATIDKVFATGWRQLKLYFMIGLPTESLEDIEAIATLANKALDVGKRYRRDVTITVSISTFVPKPHTPFQWARQLSLKETIERQDILKNKLRRRGLELKWHSAQLSFLEGVFSRGDRSLAPVIVEAWKNGARFDAWDESFKFDAWQKAFEICNLKSEIYLSERLLDSSLPWDHLFTELDHDFLRSEYERAISVAPTPDCVSGKCSKCGVCDFKEVKNVISAPPFRHTTGGQVKKGGEGGFKENAPPINPPRPPFTKGGDILTFTYSKTGIMRWLSHLELMQVFRRAFRRAGLPVKYSQGFHPHMKLSLERALKVGEEGVGLKGTVELENCHREESREAGRRGDLPNSIDCGGLLRPPAFGGQARNDMLAIINSHLPDGINVTEADFLPPKGQG